MEIDMVGSQVDVGADVSAALDYVLVAAIGASQTDALALDAGKASHSANPPAPKPLVGSICDRTLLPTWIARLRAK